MKNQKKFLAAFLSLTTVLGISACGAERDAETTTAVTTTPAATTNTLDDDIKNPVNIEEFVEEDKTLENPNLTYFGFYDMRVAGDIKPGVKLFEETYGGKIDYLNCAWGERIDKLQVLIASGDSPDLVDKEDVTFPHLMSKNVYEDLTDYIDLSQPQWAGYETLVENFSWNGEHYYYPFTANAIPNCLIYDKGRFAEFGIEDPKELYEAGNWTWDTFRETMIKFMDNQEGALGGVYGLLGNDIIISTGTPLIGIADGKITNNMSTPEVERATAFLMKLRKDGLTARGDGMWSNESEPLANGTVAFLGVGQWKITDFCKQYPEQEFGFVPYPRDPSADEYYYGSTNFGYMVPSGSKNVEGAAAFINIMRQCNTDPDLMAVVRESIMNDKQYSEEQYEFLSSFEQIANYNMVVNVSGGFNSDLTTLIDNMLVTVAFETGEDKSWTQLREENEGMINSVLDTYVSE